MVQGIVVEPSQQTPRLPIGSRSPLSVQPADGRRSIGALGNLISGRLVRFEVLSLALLLVAWLVVFFATERLSFTIAASSPVFVSVELASALARLFGALVLLLVLGLPGRAHVRWVGIGIVVLGLGQLGLAYAYALFDDYSHANNLLYAILMIWSIAAICFVIGLLPNEPPQPSIRLLGPVLAAGATVVALAVVFASRLPELITASFPQPDGLNSTAANLTFTDWHRALSLIPTGLVIVAAVASKYRCPGTTPPGWLTLAMLLLAGAQLHHAFWPSTYSPGLTSETVLRFSFSVLVAAGGALELRRVAAERARAIQAERADAQRLSELAVLRADFTSMVVHEIGSPLAAIRAYADILEHGDVDPAFKTTAVSTIRNQVDHLRDLVQDVTMIAKIESDEFDVRPCPLPLKLVLADAAEFAASLPGDHPVSCALGVQERVNVDPVRIAQVMRNLLSNAAKYSPDGTPIEVRALRRGDRRMRIEVIDQGYGIPADDLSRIFEKFGRGRGNSRRTVAGSGLGLYISRFIVEAHGSSLSVSSTPGVGSVFGFELEIAE